MHEYRIEIELTNSRKDTISYDVLILRTVVHVPKVQKQTRESDSSTKALQVGNFGNIDKFFLVPCGIAEEREVNRKYSRSTVYRFYV